MIKKGGSRAGFETGTIFMMKEKIEEKKAYVISQIGHEKTEGEKTEGLTDEFFEHTYRAMKDYGMSVYASERWAWLNTLFGYDIGAERAQLLITWYDDNGLDVLDLASDDKDPLKNVAELELGLHFNYAGFKRETPDAIAYSWPTYIIGK